ncbi:GNAT family N-acetyltransferase [Sphaerochaeta globosa]|nr:GNAT family N-acetyltransferase [Sphaerochaeta globosa]
MDRMEQTVIYLEAGSASLPTNAAYLALCQQVRRSVFVKEQGVSESIDFDGKDGLCAHLLLLFGDDAVGTLRIRVTENGTKLERISIVREYRKQGLGELLVRCALALAEGPVYIHAQVQSEGFYQRLGFVVQDQRIFYEADIPHKTMIWPHEKGALPCTITRPS